MMTRRPTRVYGRTPVPTAATGAAGETPESHVNSIVVQLAWYGLLLGVALFIAVKVSP